MNPALFGAAAFLLTFIETVVSTKEGRADRQATSCKDNRFSKQAAHWAGVFEALLLVDMILLYKEPGWVFLPIVAGAWIGKYWSVERRRKKFRARTKKPKRVSPQQET